MSESSKITTVAGTGIALRGNDIDTDRIIPARFLKCVTFDGLGEYVFYDERYDDMNDHAERDHPFNKKESRSASILIVNKNFGCGSSREHAPQSLFRFGIRAIIGESFAEIFAGNCTTLGIPACTAPGNAVDSLMRIIEEKPETAITVNVKNKSVTYGGIVVDVDMPEPARYVLLKGAWDSVAELLRNRKEIKETARKIPYLEW